MITERDLPWDAIEEASILYPAYHAAADGREFVNAMEDFMCHVECNPMDYIPRVNYNPTNMEALIEGAIANIPAEIPRKCFPTPDHGLNLDAISNGFALAKFRSKPKKRPRVEEVLTDEEQEVKALMLELIRIGRSHAGVS